MMWLCLLLYICARCACFFGAILIETTIRMISREISQASASTVRAHFGCIFTATADSATEVWFVFYVRILKFDNGHGVTSVTQKNIRITMRMTLAMAMRGFMRG